MNAEAEVALELQEQNGHEGNDEEEEKELDLASWMLLDAAQQGDESRVESILAEGGVNVNVRELNSAEFTALHHAAFRNHGEVLTVILSCPEIDVNARDGHSRTALMLASEQGHVQAVELLLQNRADLLICDRAGFNCLHLAAFGGHAEVVSLLVEEDDYDRFWEEPEEDDNIQLCPLIQPVTNRYESWRTFYSASTLLQLMEQKSTDANFNALHMAAKGGHVSMTVQLLRAYMAVTLKEKGFTNYPRNHDLVSNFLDRVKKVVSERISPDSDTTVHTDTVIQFNLKSYWRSLRGYNWRIQFSDVFCIQRDEVNVFVERLVDAFVRLISYSNSADKSKRTCLHFIALHCRMHKLAWDAAKCLSCSIKQLLELGTFDVNHPDIDHDTPLHLAARVNNICLVRHTLDTALIPNLAARNWQQFTPLKTALIYNAPIYNAPGNKALISNHNLLCGRTTSHSVQSFREARVESETARRGWEREPYDSLVAEILERELIVRFGKSEVVDRGLSGASCELLWSLKEMLEGRQISQEEDTRLRKGFEEDDHYGGLTLLHYAAFRGFAKEMQTLLELPKFQSLVNMLSHGTGQSPLHLAVIEGRKEVVKLLLDQRKTLLLRLTEEDAFDRTPVELARKSKIFYGTNNAANDDWKAKFNDLKDIEMMLLGDDDVQESIRKLNNDRQDYVDATNAILVGAALIASVTYAGWLQPPLGLQHVVYPKAPDSATISAPPPYPIRLYAAIELTSVHVFWIFNSLSFFFAIATVVSGAAAVLKSSGSFVADEVREIQGWLVRTSFLLVISITCVLGAFGAAGFAALPPRLRYHSNIICTVFVGGLVCLIVIVSFFRRLLRMLPRRFRTKLEGWIIVEKPPSSESSEAVRNSVSSFDHGLYRGPRWSLFGT